MLKSVSNGLDKMQGHENCGTVFKIYSDWIKDLKESTDTVASEMLKFVTERWDLISDDVHAACFFLNPKYVDKPYESADLKDATKYFAQVIGATKWKKW